MSGQIEQSSTQVLREQKATPFRCMCTLSRVPHNISDMVWLKGSCTMHTVFYVFVLGRKLIMDPDAFLPQNPHPAVRGGRTNAVRYSNKLKVVCTTSCVATHFVHVVFPKTNIHVFRSCTPFRNSDSSCLSIP